MKTEFNEMLQGLELAIYGVKSSLRLMRAHAAELASEDLSPADALDARVQIERTIDAVRLTLSGTDIDIFARETEAALTSESFALLESTKKQVF